MRHPALIALAILLVINFGCGRQMSEQAAIETLQSTPLDLGSGGSARTALDPDAPATIEDLNALVNHLVQTNQVKLNSKTRASLSLSNSARALDLSFLTQIISLLQGQNGQPSIIELVKTLLSKAPAGAAGTKIEAILALIQQLAPIITQIAPKFSPVIAAVITILPMVIKFIQLFKKPSTAFNEWAIQNA